MELVDVSNPAVPAKIGAVTNWAVFDIKILDKYAVVASSTAGARLLDLSDPMNPTLLKNLPGMEAKTFELEDTLLVQLGGRAGLTLYDVDIAIIKPPEVLMSADWAPKKSIGTEAALGIGATGTPPLYYLWKRNGEPLLEDARIRGVTNSVLTFSEVRLEDTGTYSVTISNQAGIANADISLTVLPLPRARVVKADPFTIGVVDASSDWIEVDFSEKIDPADWKPVTMVLTGLQEFTDLNHTGQAGFYRIRAR
jgi:hypothetical protein